MTVPCLLPTNVPALYWFQIICFLVGDIVRSLVQPTHLAVDEVGEVDDLDTYDEEGEDDADDDDDDDDDDDESTEVSFSFYVILEMWDSSSICSNPEDSSFNLW